MFCVKVMVDPCKFSEHGVFYLHSKPGRLIAQRRKEGRKKERMNEWSGVRKEEREEGRGREERGVKERQRDPEQASTIFQRESLLKLLFSS